MANLGMTFNADQYQPLNDYTPIPAGEYVAMIVNSEMKLTKAGTGKMLALEFNIVGGGNNQFNGRKLFSNLNLFNPSPKAVEIAQRELATICRAIGVMNIQDSSQLHNKPMVVKVSVSDDGKRNEINMYASVNGASAAPAYPQPTQSAQTYAPPTPSNPEPTNTQPPMGEAPPWG